MGVQYTLIRQDSTTGPGAAAAVRTWGENIPAGPISEIVFDIAYDLSSGAEQLSDMGSIFDSVRLTLNGEVLHDFRAGYTAVDTAAPSLYGYFLNSIGGRAYEIPTDSDVVAVSKRGLFAIPVGVQAPAGVSRLEAVIGTSAVGGTVSNLDFKCYLRYNTNTQTMTRIVPSTSFVHSTSIEQVVVRVPGNLPAGSVVSAILVQNDSAADELGSQGIRLMSQSAYGLDATFWRLWNGDLANGVMWGEPAATPPESLAYAQKVDGGLLIPTYGLTTNGDVILQVDSSAATTRTYTPVITAPFGAKEGAEAKQTQAVADNTAKSILRRTVE